MVHYCQVVYYNCRFMCKLVMAPRYMNQFTLYITKFDCTTSTKPQILTTKIISALAFRHYIDKISNNSRHEDILVTVTYLRLCYLLFPSEKILKTYLLFGIDTRVFISRSSTF